MIDRDRRVSGRAATLLLALAAAGCASGPSGQQGTQYLSTMGAESVAERAAFAVDPAPMPRTASYLPVGQCSYVQTTNAPNAVRLEERSRMTIKSAAGHLQITMFGRLGPSTVVIESDGRVIGYNLLDGNGNRRTAQNGAAVEAAAAASLQKGFGAKTHMVNDISAIFPRYLLRSWHPGDHVATVTMENGAPWASYVYRGTTSHRGRTTALLDMVRSDASVKRGRPVLVGFVLVDVTTMAPTLLILESGWKTRLERVSCP